MYDLPCMCMHAPCMCMCLCTHLKVLVLGASRAGKTHLLNQIVSYTPEAALLTMRHTPEETAHATRPCDANPPATLPPPTTTTNTLPP
jgi:GTPase SAR1 family protein